MNFTFRPLAALLICYLKFFSWSFKLKQELYLLSWITSLMNWNDLLSPQIHLKIHSNYYEFVSTVDTSNTTKSSLTRPHPRQPISYQSCPPQNRSQISANIHRPNSYHIFSTQSPKVSNSLSNTLTSSTSYPNSLLYEQTSVFHQCFGILYQVRFTLYGTNQNQLFCVKLQKELFATADEYFSTKPCYSRLSADVEKTSIFDSEPLVMRKDDVANHCFLIAVVSHQ